jgi:serine/threonine-protein kinase
MLRDYGPAKTTFERVGKMFPSSSEVPEALGRIGRREGNWDKSITYFKQALALDPRNVELLTEAARTYAMLRHLPPALKLYDLALDIKPNDPDMMAARANIYQAQGDLQEAARLLAGIDEQTPDGNSFWIKSDQLILERNYSEAIRLLQARLSQFHFDPVEKGIDQVWLAFTQRLAGDSVGAKASAEQGRDTLERLYKDQPDNAFLAAMLSQAYAAMGEKDAALKEAERAIILLPRAKDPMDGPGSEENLALIQTIFGENSRAISTLTRLLQTPYRSWVYVERPVTPALLRLDPIWDPIRNDPRFQALVVEKKP